MKLHTRRSVTLIVIAALAMLAIVSCTGSDGSNGSQGSVGPAGAEGPAGVAGAQGPAGTTGSQGAEGSQGLPGAEGAAGSKGSRGSTGTQGATGATGAQGLQGSPVRVPVFVNTDWLDERLDDANILVVDLRSAEDYASGHIPGAVHMDKSALMVSETVAGLVAPPAQIVALFEKAGITNDTHVVIYEASKGLWASRLLWTLEYHGHDAVSVLDGHYASWEAEIGTSSTATPTTVATTFESNLRPDRIVTKEWLTANENNSSVVPLDTRSLGEYVGTTANAAQGGHIPNAVHLEYTHNLGLDGTLKSEGELAAMYAEAGLTPDKIAVPYCQTAVRGALGYAVLRSLGYADVRLYDGSWSEWGNATDTEVIIGTRASLSTFVSASWLQDNLANEDMLVVDLRSAADYATGHIPGAVHMDKSALMISETVAGLVAPALQVEELLSNTGIGNDTTVVIYESSNGLWASRLMWTMEYYGHDNAAVLDGQYAAWEAEIGTSSTETPVAIPTKFTVSEIDSGSIATKDWLVANGDNASVVPIDTRSLGEFEGTDVRAARGGHIPNAVHIEYKDNITLEGTYKSLPDLGAMYKDAGLDTSMTVVPYCQTAVRGALGYVILKTLGYPVRLYDGSWSEWGNDLEVPVE